ncbi:hypothetical protein KUCAC02_031603, partial [Chaenocephalus aceratus]
PAHKGVGLAVSEESHSRETLNSVVIGTNSQDDQGNVVMVCVQQGHFLFMVLLLSDGSPLE